MPYWPSIPGRERYQGEAHHAGQWPKERVDFAGKKVAVISTGASAVQLIPKIAKDVGELDARDGDAPHPSRAAPIRSCPRDRL